MPMHIVVSTKAFLPRFGGTVNYAKMLALAFAREGHRVTVITRTRGEEHSLGEVPIVRFPSVVTLLRLASETDILLQVESSWRDAWPFLLRGVPWFPTLHRGRPQSSLSDPVGFLRLALEDLAFRLGHTIGVSRFANNSWGIKSEPIGSTYDDAMFYPPPKGAEREIDVIYTGRVTRDKGALVLCEALLELDTKCPGLLRRVVFVGDGPALAELRERAKSLVARGLVDVRGPVNESSEVADLMRRSKILVFPTTPAWLEASPIVPLEGLACGCYVIASDIGGTRENVGPNGTLVPPGDPGALCAAIKRLLADPPLWDASGAQAFLSNRGTRATALQYLRRFERQLSRHGVPHNAAQPGLNK